MFLAGHDLIENRLIPPRRTNIAARAGVYFDMLESTLPIYSSWACLSL